MMESKQGDEEICLRPWGVEELPVLTNANNYLAIRVSTDSKRNTVQILDLAALMMLQDLHCPDNRIPAQRNTSSSGWEAAQRVFHHMEEKKSPV